MCCLASSSLCLIIYSTGDIPSSALKALKKLARLISASLDKISTVNFSVRCDLIYCKTYANLLLPAIDFISNLISCIFCICMSLISNSFNVRLASTSLLRLSPVLILISLFINSASSKLLKK